MVDVRRLDLDPQPSALRHPCRHAIGVSLLHRQEGGHVLHRELGLEVGGLAGDHGVGCGVGLVEAVPAEILEHVEELVGRGLADAVGDAPLDELDPHSAQLPGFLLADRIAQEIRLARGKSGELHRQTDDLILVDDDAVGRLQQGLQLGQRVGDLRPTVLPADKLVDILHGSGSVEGDRCHHILKRGRLQILEDPTHSGALHLEDPHDIA